MDQWGHPHSPLVLMTLISVWHSSCICLSHASLMGGESGKDRRGWKRGSTERDGSVADAVSRSITTHCSDEDRVARPLVHGQSLA